MIFDKYLIFTNIMCNNCILSNIYIGTKEGVTQFQKTRTWTPTCFNPHTHIGCDYTL